jgi:hypothetical protein
MAYLSKLLHQFVKALGLKAGSTESVEPRPPADAPPTEVSGAPATPGE